MARAIRCRIEGRFRLGEEHREMLPSHMANGHWCTELMERPWTDLDEEEQEVFDDWLKNAKGQDLYLLLRYAKRSRKQSSMKAMKASVGEEPID